MNHHTASMNDSALCIPFRILVIVLLVLLSNYSHVSFAQDASPTISLSQEERTWLENNSEVTLGYADSQEPQLIVNSDGSYSGIVVDLLDELNRRLGTSFKLAAFPIKELFAKAQSKEIDGILNLNPSYAERLEMLKTIEYFGIFPALFASKDLVFNGPEDIPGKTVAIIDKLYFSEKIIKEYEGQVTIKRVKSALEGLQSLQKGEADIFIGVSHNSYFISKYQLYDVAVKYIYTDWKEKTVIAVRPDWPVLVSILNKGLRSFSDIELKQIVARWVQLPEPELMDILTGEDRDWLAAHPNIVLGYTDAFEPEVIVNPDGSHSGILVDFLDELNRRLGTRITLRIDSIPGLLQKATNKEVDGILEIHPEYADKLGLLKSIGYLRAYPAVFARKNVSFAGPDDFAGKKIAIIDKVYFTEKMVREYGEQATILRVKDAIQGMKSVSEGDVDLYIGVSYNSYYITKYQIFDVVTKYIFRDFSDKFGMAVRPDWPELVPILNKGISSFSQNDIDAIVAKWVHLPQQEITVEMTPEEKAWRDQNHTVRVRATDWPPYIIINENKPPQGITVEYLKLIEERTGINFEYEVTRQPFAEFLKSMKEGQGPDMSAIIAQRPERKEYLSFSTPYIFAPYVIFAREQDEIFLDISDLAGKTVAVVKGHVMQQFLEKDFPEIELLFFDNDEQALRALSTGNADAYIGNLTVSTHIIQKRGLSNLRVVASTPYGDQILSMGNRKDWPELTSIMNKALASITEEEKTAIQNKFIALNYEQGLDRVKVIQWILILVLTSIAILLLFVFWNWQLRRKVGVRTAELEAESVERKQVVTALLDSEEKFRGLVEQSPLSIQILNLDGQTLQVNKAWQELWGISDEDLPEVLKKYNVLEDEEARKLGLTPLIKKAFKGEIVTLPVIEYDALSTMGNLELEHVEANKRWVQARFYPIRNSKGEVLNVVDIEEDITARKLADNKILDYQLRLKALASQLTIAEEKERRRLAAELHDHVGQSLVFSRIQLSGLMEQTADQGLKESIDEVSQSLLEIIKDTRDLVFDLSSPLLHEVGLSAATSQWLSKDIGEKYGLETEFIDNSENVIHDNEMNSLLFRNIRELLINVVKHAYAKKVRVCFENHQDNLVITVEDNGIGFSFNRADNMAASTDGFGLFSIQERLDDVGGALEIGSPPGKGCRVTITVPITI